MIPTPEQAYALLCEYNEGDFHREHGRVVGGVMRWYARELGYGDQADFWQTVGILHDLDFERWPDQHCIKEQQLLRDAGVDETVIHAVASHGWGMCSEVEPLSDMEKTLYTVDELTGLINAAALMRPSRSVMDMELKSAKKKFKDKRFAAGVNRDVVLKGAQMMGMELDDIITETIKGMQEVAEAIGLEMHEPQA